MSRNSIMEPPLFDGTNYPEWKVKMEHYIKAILGMKVWLSIQMGRIPPTLDDNKGRRISKPLNDWTESEYEICGNNSKALNAIYCAVGLQQFKWIATCDTAKEAWETLQTVYEKTGRLREEELMILESRFNRMEMEEDETISSYCDRLIDLTYDAAMLGRTFSNDELVTKVLWSLPERFAPKVAAIQEGKSFELDKLIDTLKAYEKFLEGRTKESNKVKTIKIQAEEYGEGYARFVRAMQKRCEK